MKKKQRSQPSVVGGSSLLVIFSVLCVAIFALMSLSSATGDTNLNDRSLETVAGYYAADTQAEELLARLRQGEVPEGVTEADGVYSYTCPITDTQELRVEVRVSGTEYEILRWQSASAVEWELDEHVNVWSGSQTD